MLANPPNLVDTLPDLQRLKAHFRRSLNRDSLSLRRAEHSDVTTAREAIRRVVGKLRAAVTEAYLVLSGLRFVL